MKMDKLAGSGNDEFYTPYYAIKPILKYIKPNSTVWCPFDTEDSFYVKAMELEGHKVIFTHIDNGEDFFTIDVPECDYIISNPPYSLKTEVLERLFDIGKPFAMLLGVVGIFESQRRFKMFRDNNFEIMYMNLAIRNLIRESKTHQLDGAIASGASQGMCTMDASLLKLYGEKKITRETVLTYCSNYDAVSKRLGL